MKRFQSVYLPHASVMPSVICGRNTAQWSNGQLPPAFNRSRWHADWKRTRYSNEKLKIQTGLGAEGVYGRRIAAVFPKLARRRKPYA